jgi:D-aminopeptidase
MPRVADLGITIGLPPSGPTGSVLDVPGADGAHDSYFAAIVEATEEAVLNSLLQAETVSGRDGHTSYRLPADELRAILATPAGRR